MWKEGETPQEEAKSHPGKGETPQEEAKSHPCKEGGDTSGRGQVPSW